MFRVQDITPPDIAQWLAGGWGLVRTSSTEPLRLTEYCDISSESTRSYVRMYTGPQEYVEREMDVASEEVYCHWPLCGAINVPIDDYTIGVVLERTTERQYRRTYYGRFVSLQIPRMWEIIKKHGRACENLTPHHSTVVWGAFFPEYPTARRALNKIMEGRAVSVAISPTLLFIGSPDRVLIYDKHKHVGHIESGRAVLTHTDDYVKRRVEKQLNIKLEQA